MHFVPVKSIEQQSMLCVHRLREGFKAERTACINRIRGLLAEFGLVFTKSPAELEAVLADVLEDASNEMNTLARLVLQRPGEGDFSEPLIIVVGEHGEIDVGGKSLGRFQPGEETEKKSALIAEIIAHFDF